MQRRGDTGHTYGVPLTFRSGGSSTLVRIADSTPRWSSRATLCPDHLRPHRDRSVADRLRWVVRLEPPGGRVSAGPRERTGDPPVLAADRARGAPEQEFRARSPGPRGEDGQHVLQPAP